MYEIRFVKEALFDIECGSLVRKAKNRAFL